MNIDDMPNEHFETLMRTIDQFEKMLAARMDEIKELREMYLLAAAELAVHAKRIKALEGKIK